MKLDVIAALLNSRKSIVGIGALVIAGLVLFFYHGAWEEKSTAIATIGGLAVSLITAIAKEDAASKSKTSFTELVAAPVNDNEVPK